MPSLPVVIIWLLAITLGGLMITGAFLIVTRDTGQRASGMRPARRQRQTTLEHWQASGEAARKRLEARSGTPATAHVSRRERSSGIGWVCDLGNNHYLDGCAAHRCRNRDGYLPPDALPTRQPAVDEATVARLTQTMIEASIRRVYAESEQRQVLQLARTAWATWQG